MSFLIKLYKYVVAIKGVTCNICAMSLRIDIIPNRNSHPQILIRRSWRENGRVRHKTVGNLTGLEPELIEKLIRVFKGGVALSHVGEALGWRRSLPHGHVAAAMAAAGQLGLRRVLHRKSSRMRDLALAAVIARVIDPASKLATARALSPETASSSLGMVLGLGEVTGREMLAMLDWLLERQRWIEKSLANRHLRGGALILYDVSSSFLEGGKCPLAAFGRSRDGKKGKKQINYGLLCGPDGCPAAVEVFAGNTADPMTLATQVAKIRSRFGISRVALAGDRGMLTTARIREDVGPAGLDWISALKSADIRKLARKGPDGGAAPLRPGELADDAVAEIASPDFPGERLMVCLNPRLREERRRKREELLRAAEAALERIAAPVRAGTLKGEAKIGRRAGRDANRRKVEKHFEITVTGDGMAFRRREEKIAAEAALDGICVIRTSLDENRIGAGDAVTACKSLSRVERAFRNVKSDLGIRPVHVHTEDHVRAHVFLCMLALYVEWHMRKALAPLLFEDHDREAAREERDSPVAPAEVSDAAKAKAASKRTPDGLPAHSFSTLLADLGTLCAGEYRIPGSAATVWSTCRPTPLQKRALELTSADPGEGVYSRLTA